MDDAVGCVVVKRPQRAAQSVSRALACFVALSAMGACAKSDPIEPGATGGLGGWEGTGGTSSTESGPEGAGGDSSASTSSHGNGVGNGGGIDGDDQSSAATGTPETCGDGTCSLPDETCETCEADCGVCQEIGCGDGTCSASDGETCDTCEADCGVCAVCGDAVCTEPAEDCELCFEDCGVCACEPDGLEPNGSSPTASPLALGVELMDLSICASDFDWFTFDLSGTRTVTIRFLQAQGDLDLEIYAQATGNYVSGSYSSDDDEAVVLSGVPAGTYWARVYGKQPGGQPGAENPSYSIIVTQ